MKRGKVSKVNPLEYLWDVEYQVGNKIHSVKRYGSSARQVLASLDFEINKKSISRRIDILTVIAIIAVITTITLILIK